MTQVQAMITLMQHGLYADKVQSDMAKEWNSSMHIDQTFIHGS